ncbi:hypothetical protein C8Q80DRAFT_1272871 [Daedaleopsis nitida]|nr:hypothetical protein C8Q80DRAFT_1272871 [Daedaleopsis nitida]
MTAIQTALLYPLPRTDDAPEHDACFMTPQDILDDYYSCSAQCYVPLASMPIEYSHSERTGRLHYLPPAAVSTRYYTLHDPNVYVDDGKQRHNKIASVQHLQILSPVDTYSSCEYSVSSPDLSMTSSYPHSPSEATTPSSACTSSLSHWQSPCPTTRQQFSPPSDPGAYAPPDLPKQRRNRDDPGGDTGPLAQLAAQCEDQMDLDYNLAYPEIVTERAGTADYASADEGCALAHEYEEQKPHVCPPRELVPSQWKLGAALDRLRFPDYGGDWSAMMARVTGLQYHHAFPRADSPLSAEDMARFTEMKTSLGLPDAPTPTRAPTPAPSPAPARDAVSPEPAAREPASGRVRTKAHANKAVIYSPTTARRIPVSTGPRGSVLQVTSAKRPYRRGTLVACAFCRRRKIACGGPQEGDEARRCG